MRRVALAAILMSLGIVAPGATSTAATVVRPLPHFFHHGNGTASSTNWSGYAAYNTTFTEVEATWKQPTATCNTAGAKYASFWVGLDGYKSSSVEQLGTDSDCSSLNHPVYYAWWEMYPNPSNQISNFPVSPGDTIFAKVSRVATVYTLFIQNVTTGKTFSTTQVATAANSSAEWVAEAPSQCIIIFCRVLPLTNFGTVLFTGSKATSGSQKSISGFANDSITMTDITGTTVRAQPGPLSSDGTSFSDTWKHS